MIPTWTRCFQNQIWRLWQSCSGGGRELNIRLLSARPISKVATQLHQMLADKKTNLTPPTSSMNEDEIAEDPDKGQMTVAKYLLKMRTLCQGYAEVGAKPVPRCPSPETRGSATIDFVERPMDVTKNTFTGRRSR